MDNIPSGFAQCAKTQLKLSQGKKFEYTIFGRWFKPPLAEGICIITDWVYDENNRHDIITIVDCDTNKTYTVSEDDISIHEIKEDKYHERRKIFRFGIFSKRKRST